MIPKWAECEHGESLLMPRVKLIKRLIIRLITRPIVKPIVKQL
jgi:hypothetical protein